MMASATFIRLSLPTRLPSGQFSGTEFTQEGDFLPRGQHETPLRRSLLPELNYSVPMQHSLVQLMWAYDFQNCLK